MVVGEAGLSGVGDVVGELCEYKVVLIADGGGCWEWGRRGGMAGGEDEEEDAGGVCTTFAGGFV